jgi:hypothetical protein
MTDEIETSDAEAEGSGDRSFVRWQGITLAQLGYAVNLILAFGTASLGFSLSLIKDESYAPGCWAKAFMALSLLLILFSIIFGIWCVINRLRSFRHTKNAARIREERDKKQKDPSQQACIDKLNADLKAERTLYRVLDERTWPLFWFQVATFGLGVLLLIASFVSVYRGKLF